MQRNSGEETVVVRPRCLPLHATHLLTSGVCSVLSGSRYKRYTRFSSSSPSSSFNSAIVLFFHFVRLRILAKRVVALFSFSSFAAALAHHTLHNPFEAACSLRNILYSLDALMLAQIRRWIKKKQQLAFFFRSSFCWLETTEWRRWIKVSDYYYYIPSRSWFQWRSIDTRFSIHITQWGRRMEWLWV